MQKYSICDTYTPKKQGFTLVELIVVIGILAVLATIAFVSYKGITVYARNSTRVTDLASIRNGLEVTATKHGYYPNPSPSTMVIYSGGLVFTQWMVNQNLVTNLEYIDHPPLDPLYGVHYTYSVLNTWLDFELWTIQEDSSLLGQNSALTSQTFADTPVTMQSTARSYLSGNYNAQMARLSWTTKSFVIPLPSLTLSNTGTTDFVDILTAHTLSYSGYRNLPSTYHVWPPSVGWFDFTPNTMPIYSTTGSLTELTHELGTATGQILLFGSLQRAYSGTTLAHLDQNKTVLNVDINADVEKARQFSEILIKNALRLNIKLVSDQPSPTGSGAIMIGNNLAWGPTIGYIDFTPAGTPISITNAYIRGYAWANSGWWINMNPTLAGVTNTCDGDLWGYAWATSLGYIDFTDARIDGNGYFQGRATTSGSGAIVFQWDHFSLKTTWIPTCAWSGTLTISSPTDNALVSTHSPTIRWRGAIVGAKVYVTAWTTASCKAMVTLGWNWNCTLAPALSGGIVSISATEMSTSGIARNTKTIRVTISN
jgi:prepilin-type N-terminal cleavage/methylation domain-containing protein